MCVCIRALTMPARLVMKRLRCKRQAQRSEPHRKEQRGLIHEQSDTIQAKRPMFHYNITLTQHEKPKQENICFSLKLNLT